MFAPKPISALMLDFACVITKTMFENMPLVDRGLGLEHFQG